MWSRVILTIGITSLYHQHTFVQAQDAGAGAGVHLSTRQQVKTTKFAGDIHHHLVMNESEYGTFMGLRPVEMAKPERNAPCFRRNSDGKWACYPDIIYIGTSKSGTTSMAAHLAYNPMVMNNTMIVYIIL